MNPPSISSFCDGMSLIYWNQLNLYIPRYNDHIFKRIVQITSTIGSLEKLLRKMNKPFPEIAFSAMLLPVLLYPISESSNDTARKIVKVTGICLDAICITTSITSTLGLLVLGDKIQTIAMLGYLVTGAGLYVLNKKKLLSLTCKKAIFIFETFFNGISCHQFIKKGDIDLVQIISIPFFIWKAAVITLSCLDDAAEKITHFIDKMRNDFHQKPDFSSHESFLDYILSGI